MDSLDLLKSGLGSDLIITCQDHDFKVHKKIVFEKCPLLAKLAEGEDQVSTSFSYVKAIPTNPNLPTRKIMIFRRALYSTIVKLYPSGSCFSTCIPATTRMICCPCRLIMVSFHTLDCSMFILTSSLKVHDEDDLMDPTITSASVFSSSFADKLQRHIELNSFALRYNLDSLSEITVYKIFDACDADWEETVFLEATQFALDTSDDLVLHGAMSLIASTHIFGQGAGELKPSTTDLLLNLVGDLGFGMLRMLDMSSVKKINHLKQALKDRDAEHETLKAELAAAQATESETNDKSKSERIERLQSLVDETLKELDNQRMEKLEMMAKHIDVMDEHIAGHQKALAKAQASENRAYKLQQTVQGLERKAQDLQTKLEKETQSFNQKLKEAKTKHEAVVANMQNMQSSHQESRTALQKNNRALTAENEKLKRDLRDARQNLKDGSNGKTKGKTS